MWLYDLVHSLMLYIQQVSPLINTYCGSISTIPLTRLPYFIEQCWLLGVQLQDHLPTIPIHLKVGESDNKSFDMKPHQIYKHKLIPCELEL